MFLVLQICYRNFQYVCGIHAVSNKMKWSTFLCVTLHKIKLANITFSIFFQVLLACVAKVRLDSLKLKSS